eukprot:scaffold8602_cov277-Pinguiococcus_pyrenoidosus.AAC.2
MQIVDQEVQVVHESTETGEHNGVEPFIEYISGNLDQCLYAVVDVKFVTDDERPTDKLVFISWIPDTSKVRDKMKYSGTKDAVLANVNGVAVKMNATDISELGGEGEEIIAKAKQYA